MPSQQHTGKLNSLKFTAPIFKGKHCITLQGIKNFLSFHCICKHVRVGIFSCYFKITIQFHLDFRLAARNTRTVKLMNHPPAVEVEQTIKGQSENPPKATFSGRICVRLHVKSYFCRFKYH